MMDDTGTLSAIPYAILTLIIMGCFLLAMGLVIDELVTVEQEMSQDISLPYSQQRADTFAFIIAGWSAMGIITVLVILIFLIMNGVQSQTGGI